MKFKTAVALNNSLKSHSPYETLRCALVRRLTKEFLLCLQASSCVHAITTLQRRDPRSLGRRRCDCCQTQSHVICLTRRKLPRVKDPGKLTNMFLVLISTRRLAFQTSFPRKLGSINECMWKERIEPCLFRGPGHQISPGQGDYVGFVRLPSSRGCVQSKRGSMKLVADS